MEDHTEVQEALSRTYGMDDIDESELDAGLTTFARSFRFMCVLEFDALDDYEFDATTTDLLDDVAVPSADPGTF